MGKLLIEQRDIVTEDKIALLNNELSTYENWKNIPELVFKTLNEIHDRLNDYVKKVFYDIVFFNCIDLLKKEYYCVLKTS